MTLVWIAVIVALVVVFVMARRLRRPDPVDSFRRQIDALSPEARRPTVDKVRDAAEENGETGHDDT